MGSPGSSPTPRAPFFWSDVQIPCIVSYLILFSFPAHPLKPIINLILGWEFCIGEEKRGILCRALAFIENWSRLGSYGMARWVKFQASIFVVLVQAVFINFCGRPSTGFRNGIGPFARFWLLDFGLKQLVRGARGHRRAPRTPVDSI